MLSTTCKHFGIMDTINLTWTYLRPEEANSTDKTVFLCTQTHSAQTYNSNVCITHSGKYVNRFSRSSSDIKLQRLQREAKVDMC